MSALPAAVRGRVRAADASSSRSRRSSRTACPSAAENSRTSSSLSRRRGADGSVRAAVYGVACADPQTPAVAARASCPNSRWRPRTSSPSIAPWSRESARSCSPTQTRSRWPSTASTCTCARRASSRPTPTSRRPSTGRPRSGWTRPRRDRCGTSIAASAASRCTWRRPGAWWTGWRCPTPRLRPRSARRSASGHRGDVHRRGRHAVGFAPALAAGTRHRQPASPGHR